MKRLWIEFGPAPRLIDQGNLFGWRMSLPGVTLCTRPKRTREEMAAVAATQADIQAAYDRAALAEDKALQFRMQLETMRDDIIARGK